MGIWEEMQAAEKKERISDLLAKWQEAYNGGDGTDLSPRQLCPEGNQDLWNELARQIADLRDIIDTNKMLTDMCGDPNAEDENDGPGAGVPDEVESKAIQPRQQGEYVYEPPFAMVDVGIGNEDHEEFEWDELSDSDMSDSNTNVSLIGDRATGAFQFEKGAVVPGSGWQLEEPLGEGGFGFVWKASHPEHGLGAIKFCRDLRYVKTLTNEAKQLKRIKEYTLSEEGFVELRHICLSDAYEIPHLVYEYIQGEDFDTFLSHFFVQNGPFKPQAASEIIYDLAMILARIHGIAKTPIVHRDIKPSNIMVLNSEQPFQFKILDLGLGVIAASESVLARYVTHSDDGREFARGGTRGYMSYEQAKRLRERGSLEVDDPSDDVHALGVIWYSLLKGELEPFDSMPPSHRPEFIDWAKLREGIQECGLDESQAELVLSCLKRQEHRPKNAGELAARIRKLFPPLKDKIGAVAREIEQRRLDGQDWVQYLHDAAREGVADWNEGCNKGLPEARWIRGLCWEHGVNVNRAHPTSYLSTAGLDLASSANAGFANAQYDWAFYWENGLGDQKQDLQEAFRWIQKAASQGHRDACYELGLYYLDGKGVEPDRVKAIQWLKKAADQGHKDACYRLGHCLNEDCVPIDILSPVFELPAIEDVRVDGEPIQALQLCEFVGNIPSQLKEEEVVTVADVLKLTEYRFVKNSGCHVDGWRLFRRIQSHLAEVWLDPWQELKTRATNYLNMSADLGHVEARHEIGDLEGAAACGHVQLQYELGESLQKQIEDVDDPVERISLNIRAQKWLRLAAHNGNAEAQCLLASSSWDLELRNEEKLLWLRKAGVWDGNDSRILLWRWVPNESEARQWLLLAAEEGSMEAQITYILWFHAERNFELYRAEEWLRDSNCWNKYKTEELESEEGFCCTGWPFSAFIAARIVLGLRRGLGVDCEGRHEAATVNLPRQLSLDWLLAFVPKDRAFSLQYLTREPFEGLKEPNFIKPPPIRIHSLAEKLKMDNQEVIQVCNAAGVEATVPVNTLSIEEVSTVLDYVKTGKEELLSFTVLEESEVEESPIEGAIVKVLHRPAVGAPETTGTTRSGSDGKCSLSLKVKADGKTDVCVTRGVETVKFSLDLLAKHRSWRLLMPRAETTLEEITNSIGVRLRLIPAGEFVMGSPEGEEDHRAMEGPLHQVRITRPFYLGIYQVTQSHWEQVMESRPWSDGLFVKDGSDYPAVKISWHDAVEFCSRLSSLEGCTYRLPTEAEWEYACRAGTRTSFSFGDNSADLDAHGWFVGNSGSVARRVGKKKANPWGLYDMHGNVLEWCYDWFAQDYYTISSMDDPTGPSSASDRVCRGGGMDCQPRLCRSASRTSVPPDRRLRYLGFRVVKVPAE